ncbi:MAG TPA: FAD-dependent oxidoreductase, partial [Candidatus Paceibacterota bacterium]|nr:FAD-dependent oxidoreductase [Candidatus Paceibacterota bacterium]
MKPKTSFWQKESFFHERDLIIVGAGLAGLWLAFNLKIKNQKLKILILEKGDFPDGASLRNAGFACFGSPSEILADYSIMGEEVWNILDHKIQGIRMMREFLGDEAVNYDPSGGYECIIGSDNISKLRDKVEILNQKLYPMTQNTQVFSWCGHERMEDMGLTCFSGMIQNRLEGSIHSGMLIKELMKRVKVMGVEILTSMEVVKYAEEKFFVHLLTSKGYQFACRKLFICTNGLTKKLVKDAPMRPARGQIILTSEIPNLPLRGTFHATEGFYYFKNLGNRVLLGGGRNFDMEGEMTTDTCTTQPIKEHLQDFMRRHILFGRHYRIEYDWAGTMALTELKKPLAYSPR